MNFEQNLHDREVDFLWYGGINDVHNNRMSFHYFAAYLDAINHECDDWQSAH